MRNTTFLPTRSMTKNDVLETIRDSYRFAQKLDPEAEPGYDLTFDTTIEDWRKACDLLAARDLGQALNAWFGVRFSDMDWMATLDPAKTATLGGVCDLVASKAKMPDTKEFSILGTECLSAGVFLTIRTALAEEGVATEDIRPSTALEPIALKHLTPLIQTVGRVAPGVLTVPDVKYKLAFRISLWLSFVGMCFGVLTSLTRWPGLAFLGFVIGAFGLVSAVLWSNFGQALRSVSFPEMRDFRDLTSAIIERKQTPNR
jgi:hypothetical protein